MIASLESLDGSGADSDATDAEQLWGDVTRQVEAI
jgi:hypothetical protein